MGAVIENRGRKDIDYVNPGPANRDRSTWKATYISSRVPDYNLKPLERDYDKCPRCGGRGTYYESQGIHKRVKRLTKCECEYGSSSPI